MTVCPAIPAQAWRERLIPTSGQPPAYISLLAAATASPAAFAIAATAASEGRQGRFLEIVGAGLTTSLVAGVSAGAWIGGELG